MKSENCLWFKKESDIIIFIFVGKDLYPFRYKIMGGGLDYGKQKYDNCFRFGSVRFGSVRFGSVRFGSVRFGRSIVPFF